MFDSKSLFPSLKFAIFQHFIGSTIVRSTHVYPIMYTYMKWKFKFLFLQYGTPITKHQPSNCKNLDNFMIMGYILFQ